MKYWKSLTLLIFFFVISPLYSKFHPEIKWEELSSDKFIIIYPEGYKSLGYKTMGKAGILYKELKKFWKSDINGKVRILLTDNTDLPEESSTFFPYNQIRISLFPSPPDSLFGSYYNWINSVLRFGLNKIFIYNQGSEFISFMRRYFGDNPMFFPTILIPSWIFEGLATLPDSIPGENIRFLSPEFGICAEKVLAGRKLPKMSSLKGNCSEWPGPASKYIYGRLFVKKLSEKYKKGQILDFVKNYSKYPLPFLIKELLRPAFLSASGRFYMTFNEKIKDFWREAGNKYTDLKPLKYTKTGILTSSGFYKKYPVHISDKEIVFFRNDLKAAPGVYKLNLDSKKISPLFEKFDVNGISYFKKDKILYFSAVDYHKSFYRFSDIFLYNFNTGRIKQVTKGKRLFSPVRIGNRIYCIKREKDSAALAYFKIKTGEVKLLPGRFSSISKIAVSPDERYIAASVKRDGVNWRIGVFDKSGNFDRYINVNGNKAYYPVWNKENELFFISEFNNGYSLSKYFPEENSLKIYDSPDIPPVRYFDPGSDNTMVVSFIDSNGFNLGTLNLDDYSPVKVENNPASEEISPGKVTEFRGESKKYNISREFLPKYFTLSLRLNGEEVQPGFVFSGFDSLGKHYFNAKVFYGLKSDKFNYSFKYIFDGIYGSLGLNYSKYSDLKSHGEKGDFLNTSEKIILSYDLPLFKNNQGLLALYSDIHIGKESDNFYESSVEEGSKYNGLKTGIYFKSAKAYYDSHSLSDGADLYVIYIRDLKSIGSNFNINTAVLGMKQYISLFRPNTMVFRFVLADSWGEGRRRFYLGGSGSKENNDLTDDNPFSLMRGYPAGYFEGSGGFSLNVEYRMLLTKIERSFLVSKSVERLFFTLFADTGQVWNNDKRIDPVFSAGGELNLVFYLGKRRYVLSCGTGVGIHPKHSPRFFVRIGNSF